MTAITIPNTFLPSTTISSTAMNQNFSTVATAIQASLALDGSDTMTGQLRAAAGTAVAPGYAFGLDLDVGMYRKAANELGFATAGVLGLFLDASQKLWATGAVDVAGALTVAGAFSLSTPLGISSGGTGQITASAAFGALKQDATESATGVVDMATDAEIRAAASGAHGIMAEDLETAAAPVTLTDAATIAVDWDTFINGVVTLGGNRTLGNPTNGQPGTWRRIQFNQDGTGSRTITWSNQYVHPGGVDAVLSTAASAIDTIYIYCRSSTVFEVYVGGKAWAT